MSKVAVMNQYEMVVVKWIEEHFDTSAVSVEDFRVLPYGKRIIDCHGDEMVAFYNYFKERVETFFPGE